MKKLSELGASSGHIGINHPNMIDSDESEKARRLRDILSKNESTRMKSFKQLISEIDDQVPDVGMEDQEVAPAYNQPAKQFLPQFSTQHALDGEIEGMLAGADIHPGDWSRPGSDTYQKYQAFIQALWKEIEFKRGRK